MNLRVILVPNHFIFTAMHAHCLVVLPKYMGQINNEVSEAGSQNKPFFLQASSQVFLLSW